MKYTKYDGIAGVGFSPLSDENINQNQQGTFYGGLQVTEEVKQQLENQEIGLFVQFDKQKDDSYIMRPQIPEKGMDEDGKTYSIRKNMNRILKGIASQFVDKDGVVDLKKAKNAFGQLTADFGSLDSNPYTRDDKYRALVDYRSLSRKEKNDFDLFIHTNSEYLDLFMCNMIYDILNNVESLHAYNANLYRSDLDDDQKALLKDSELEFEQFLDDYRNMAKMDPVTERNTYIPGVCSTSARFNQLIYKDVLRAEKGPDYIPKQASCQKNISLDFKDPDNYSFDRHALTAFDVTLGQDNVVFTLETTAPPGAKLLFHPERSFGGVGIYDNREKIEEMYNADNNRTFGRIPSKQQMDKDAKDNLTYNPPIMDSAVLAGKLKNNKKWFGKDSEDYINVSDRFNELAEIEKAMKDHPSRADELRNELRNKCKELADNSQKYLESRNPSSSNGKLRYDMVQKANEYATQLANRMDRLYSGDLSLHKKGNENKKAVNLDTLLEMEGITRNRSNAVKRAKREVKKEVNKQLEEGRKSL